MQPQAKTLAVIACGAIAREIHQLRLANRWHHVKMFAIDAALHFKPQLIPGAVAEKIEQIRSDYDHIYVAFADCGTYGGLDDVLKQYQVERLPGLHCYATFAGEQTFERLNEEEPGTFYLTDFLVRHFDRFVTQLLKLDTNPELIEAFFGNYKKVLYLAQTQDHNLVAEAQRIAKFLSLDYEYRDTGYGELTPNLQDFVQRTTIGVQHA